MSCDICGRSHHPVRLPFFCAVDARNRLYEGRMAHAEALIENEALEKKVNDALEATAVAAKDPVARKVGVDAWKSEQRLAVERTNEILAQADRLREDVKTAREEIERRKASNSRRKADLAAVSHGVAERRAKQQDDVERANTVLQSRWDLEHDHTAATRAFLCMEAARLYGLRRLRKGSSARYEIGGVEIVDIQSLGAASPEVISTSLAHMTHILMLASHYLSIRLPAEITLPKPDYPRPTIFSLASSYSHHPEVPFPGSSNLPTQILLEESQGRDRRQRLPRARPLFIEKPLATLAKEDPSTYSLFIEGVALLSYNIAWACCSQGVPIGDRNSSEDVCHMGRNLYSLLIGNNQVHATQAGRLFPVASSPSRGSDNEGGTLGRTAGAAATTATATTAAAAHIFGRYSHGSSHTFLGSADGSDFARSFKIPNPIKLADQIKSKLGSETSAPDWELLEDDAWADGDGPGEGFRQVGG